MYCVFTYYLSYTPPSPPLLTFGSRHSYGCGRIYVCSPPGGTKCPSYTLRGCNKHSYYYTTTPFRPSRVRLLKTPTALELHYYWTWTCVNSVA